MSKDTAFIWKDWPRTLRIVGYRGGRFFPPIPVTEPDCEHQALLRVARAAKAYKEYPPNWKQGIVQERIAIWKEYCEALKEVEHLLD